MENSPTMPHGSGTDRLRVLMVSNHSSLKTQYPYAGIFVDRQIDSLQRAGIKVRSCDMDTIRSPIGLLKCWRQLRKVASEFQPDLVHAQYGSVVGFMAVLLGYPTVVSFCGHDLLSGAEMDGIRMRVGFLLSNLSALFAKAMICKSEELRQALWWRKDRAVVIPNGVDLELFSPGLKGLAREILQWDQHAPTVLLVIGSNPKRKGLDLANAAMDYVRRQIPAAKLHLIHDVQPSLMPQYYRAADVLLCASKREGSPNAVKEALACNLPIVSVPVGDVGERLLGVSHSKIVSRDPDAIGRALIEILIAGKRSNGRDSMELLSIDRVGQRVCDVYRLAVSGTQEARSRATVQGSTNPKSVAKM